MASRFPMNRLIGYGLTEIRLAGSGGGVSPRQNDEQGEEIG
jgi:hypothetical protein